MYNSRYARTAGFVKAFLLSAVVSLPSLVTGQVITTLVGGSKQFGATTDGVYAAYATLNNPAGLAVDNHGNVYVSDQNNNKIRKVNIFGVITTIAGFGSAGSSGDGGPSEKAKIFAPAGMALDKHGNLFFADSKNNRIRKIDTAGIISTVAGNGVNGLKGDDSLAIHAELNNPKGVAVDDAGNLFIADELNNRVRMVNTSGIITTLAGTDDGNNFLGNGSPATTVRLNKPNDVKVDKDGNVYIADTYNNFIRKVEPDGTLTNVAGSGTTGFGGDNGVAGVSKINIPVSMALDRKGNLYFADKNNNRVRKIDAAGIVSTVAGNGANVSDGDGGSALEAQVNAPTAVAVDSSGNLYVGEGKYKIRYVYLDKLIDADKITVFPNPCNKNTIIFLPSMYEEIADVFVLNTQGRLVSRSIGPTNKHINIKFEAAGTYIMYAISKHGNWTGRVVVFQ